MNNKFSNIVLFVFGAVIGSIATWQYAKKKYEQRVHDDIDSVKEVLLQRPIAVLKDKPDETSKQAAEEAKSKPNISEYASKIREQGYINYSKSERINQVEVPEKEEKESETMVIDRPYVISPDNFAEFDDYETISLTYYADQVLADDDDEPIEDIENIVGFESLTSFGEYEDDSVFVRNDQLKCDYEILLDHRKYSDVVKRKPHGVDD